jgi:hypothetical protein
MCDPTPTPTAEAAPTATSAELRALPDEYRSVLIAYQRFEPNAKITAMLTDLLAAVEAARPSGWRRTVDEMPESQGGLSPIVLVWASWFGDGPRLMWWTGTAWRAGGPRNGWLRPDQVTHWHALPDPPPLPDAAAPRLDPREMEGQP